MTYFLKDDGLPKVKPDINLTQLRFIHNWVIMDTYIWLHFNYISPVKMQSDLVLKSHSVKAANISITLCFLKMTYVN